jgi:hypothetical protein
VAERSKAAVLKTAEPVTVPGVRIPSPPPEISAISMAQLAPPPGRSIPIARLAEAGPRHPVHPEHSPPEGRSIDDDGPRRSATGRCRGPGLDGLVLEKKPLAVDWKHHRVDEDHQRVHKERHRVDQLTHSVDEVTLRVDKKPHSRTSPRLSVDEERHFQTTERQSSMKDTHLVDTMTLLWMMKALLQTSERLSLDNERHLLSSGRQRQTTKRHLETKVRLSVMTVTQSLDRRTA